MEGWNQAEPLKHNTELSLDAIPLAAKVPIPLTTKVPPNKHGRPPCHAEAALSGWSSGWGKSNWVVLTGSTINTVLSMTIVRVELVAEDKMVGPDLSEERAEDEEIWSADVTSRPPRLHCTLIVGRPPVTSEHRSPFART